MAQIGLKPYRLLTEHFGQFLPHSRGKGEAVSHYPVRLSAIYWHYLLSHCLATNNFPR
ncbi:MAG: hypothetical protein K940chlam7_01730, partial [Chlamydiae bacterium]|nr:hypothetical protein [Chlamydiota bacterium]